MQQMEIKYRRLDTITDLPGNAKLHSGDIQQSITDFGFLDALGINPGTMHNLDGNGRLAALKMMYAAGMPAPLNIQVKKEKVDGQAVSVWYVPTVDLPFDAETEPIVAMRLNRSHDKGGYDEQKVFAVLEQAAAYGRLEQTGFDETILEVLSVKYSTSEEGDGDGDDGNSLKPQRSIIETKQAQHQEPVQPLSPSKTMTVQIFLEAEQQNTFLEMCSQLIKRCEIRREDGTPVETLSELIFSLVRNANNE